MKDQEKKLLISLGNIDDKYLDQAKPRKRENRMPRILTIAASLVLVVGISLWVLLSGMLGQGGSPILPDGGDNNGGKPPIISDNDANNPFPEVSKPSKSLASVMQDFLLSDNVGSNYPDYDYGWGDVPEDDGYVGEGGVSGEANGSYVEVTDNQVEGIIEADLYKTTDKYIFRYRNKSLTIYSIDGDNSKEISSLYISSRGGTYFSDMFLSDDGETVTVINQEYVYKNEDHPYSGHDITVMYSIDVSDVSNPKIVKTLGIAGMKQTVRKIDGQIYVVTSVGFDRNNIDIENPESYIPGIVYDDGVQLCNVDNIYYPDEIRNASYIYVNVLDEDDLSLSDEYAIISNCSTWVPGVRFTKNHILVEYQTGRKIREEDGYPISEACTMLEIIDFSLGTLRYCGSLEIRGFAESGQYSYDEKDGYLRVVTTTQERKRYRTIHNSASLYVYDLSTMTLAASVEDFAPEGERATAVRFEGDKLYVCTAETRQFTDPVFFFDLSDYSNITQVNTGYIDGFSSSLIDLGEGYLLGIGRESREQGKIEVYKREGDTVVSVAEFLFYGITSSVYKSYLIDRENNLFGFASDYYRITANGERTSVYVVLQLDGERLRVVEEISIAGGGSTSRAFYRDGYVYYSGNSDFKAVRVDVE